MATRKFKIYRSSAGSGKTFTLTKEYLKLALLAPGSEKFDPSYYNGILAVTFTRDATNEMKERIMQKLSAFASLSLENGETDDLLEVIVAEIGEQEFGSKDKAAKELCRRAKMVHEKLLHNYSDFSVSTIDAFNQKVVQAFKKDLDLPFNFELELDNRELLEEAVYLLQDKVGEDRDKAVSQLLVEFVLKKTEEEKNWHIENDLFEFGKNLFNEDNSQIVNLLKGLTLENFKKIKSELFQYVEHVENTVKQYGREAIELIDQNNIDVKHLFQSGRGIYGYFQKMKDLSSTYDKIEPNSYVHKTINEDNWLSAKGKKEAVGAVESIKPDLIDKFNKIEQFRQDEQLLSNYIIANQVRKRIYLLATINEIDNLLTEIKEEKNIVHIADVNAKINEIIDGEPVPYIYERIGERYKHILIDEFQDTSKMQWHNLVPLVSNALTNYCLCLVVGDAKQAIYRWRGGRAEMLAGLPELPTAKGLALEQEASVFRQHDNPQDLDTNYRSYSNVIDFNNNLFDTLLKHLEYPTLKQHYEQVKQKTNKRKGGQAVISTIKPLDGTYAYVDATLEYTLQEVQRLHDEQGFKYSDIALLVRKNGQGVQLAQHLMAHGISVISSESLLLTNSTYVDFLITFLKLLVNYTDASLKLKALRFLREHTDKVSGEGTAFFEGEDYLKLAEEILQNYGLKEFVLLINNLFQVNLDLQTLQFLSLYEIIEELMRELKLNEVKEEQIYLHKFMEVILDFSQKKGNSLQEFLQYWKLKKDTISITTPSGGDAVKVMTIHKSKGLEFPVVIMPFADWSVVPRNDALMWKSWEGNAVSPALNAVTLGVSSALENTAFKPEYEEEKEAVFIDAFNVFYVGVTRAGEYLHIITRDKAVGKNGKIQDLSQLMSLLIGNTPLKPVEETNINLPEIEPIAEIINYEFFEEYKHQVKEEKADTLDYWKINHFIHSQNRGSIKLKSNEAEEGERFVNIVDVVSAKKQGIMVHKAFEHVTYQDEIPDAVRRLVHEGYISHSEVIDIVDQMQRVVEMPEIKAFYQPDSGYIVKNETELLLKNRSGKTLETIRSLRPDRLMLKDKEAIVIDYKTGGENEKYADQLSQYGKELRYTGFETVRMLIVYTELLKVEEVKQD